MRHANRHRSFDLLPAIAYCLALLAAWPVPAAPLPPDRQAAIDEFVGRFERLAMFDGIVLVDIGGEIVYERTFGRANYEFDVAHTRETRFRIASVSKSITDAAVAKLIQRGRLSRDVPLAEFMPDFPAAERITIGHLLDHRSGIPHTNRQPWGDGSVSLPHDEILDRLAALPLDFEPGSEEAYSNGGYAVLARVVEIAGGAGFGEVLRSLVLGPLGMDGSGHIEDVRQPLARLATGYEPGLVPGTRRHARFYAVETRPGGGSMYATAPDVLRFVRALFRENFVPEDLGRSVMGLDGDGYLSQGRSPGFVAKVLYRPAGDVMVVSLANNYAVQTGWADAIAGLATGEIDEDPWPPLVEASRVVPPDDPRIGRYENSFGPFEIEIARDENGFLLSLDDTNRAYAALIPLADGDYLQPQYYQRCSQDRDTRVITCRMLSGDERYTSVLTPLTE